MILTKEVNMKKLTCDMIKDCTDKVKYIDSRGFIYCECHGKQRKMSQPCRKLTIAELNKLTNGQKIERY